MITVSTKELDVSLYCPIKGRATYNPDWSHLEKAKYVGTIHILSNIQGEDQEYQDAIDETYSYKVLVMEKGRACGATNDEIKKALRFEWAAGCSCEHDCCGHFFGGINSKIVRYGDSCWTFESSYSRNY